MKKKEGNLQVRSKKVLSKEENRFVTLEYYCSKKTPSNIIILLGLLLRSRKLQEFSKWLCNFTEQRRQFEIWLESTCYKLSEVQLLTYVFVHKRNANIVTFYFFLSFRQNLYHTVFWGLGFSALSLSDCGCWW